MPKDRFHEYLDYCDGIEIMGVGDYIEQVARGETLAWTFLMRDVHDTYKAGKLVRVTAANGSAAYVRPTCPKLHPNDTHTQQEGISNEHVR
jgi:hypothetical protein